MKRTNRLNRFQISDARFQLSAVSRQLSAISPLLSFVCCLILLLSPGWGQAGSDTETIYPNSAGDFRPNWFRYETGCTGTQHYNCVGNESDASYVNDSTRAGGNCGEESFNWVCSKTWQTIDSIKITMRAKNSGLFGEQNSIAFGYYYNDGEMIYGYGLDTISTGTSFNDFSVVTDTNQFGQPWTQGMIEGDDYEFGFWIYANSTTHKYVSSFKLTIYGTEAVAGDKAAERRIRNLKESGRR